MMLAHLIKKDAPQYKNLPADLEGKRQFTIDFYNKNLIRHFRKEEILFEELNGVDNTVLELADELLREHVRIYHLIERLKSKTDVENDLDEIGHLLTEHIRKEERVLFEKLQTQLTDSELARISEIIFDDSESGGKQCLTPQQ